MTVPTVRKRAWAPKSRNGCRKCKARHIKCDELRPTCSQCLEKGHACDGYTDVREHTEKQTSSRQLLPRKVIDGSPSPLLHVAQTTVLRLTDFEIAAFDFFRCVTAHQIPGAAFEMSWEKIAMQQSQHESTVMAAIVAVGAMHRSTLGDSPVDAHRVQAQYGKALRYLRRSLLDVGANVTDRQIDVIIPAALLLLLYEAFSERDEQVAVHLRMACRLLQSHLSGHLQPAQPDMREVSLRSPPRSSTGVLVATLVRLDADMTTPRDGDTFFVPVCTDAIDHTFSSLDAANIHLDVLAARVDCLSDRFETVAESLLAKDRSDDSFIDGTMAAPPECSKLEMLSRAVDILIADLESWRAAFCGIRMDPHNQSEHLLTDIFYHFLRWSAQTVLSRDEMIFDAFDDEFAIVVAQAETYLQLLTTSLGTDITPVAASCLGTGLVDCLSTTALKCRTSRTRRRCVELLSRINMRGVFDSAYLVAFLTTAIDLEESLASQLHGGICRDEFHCFEVPEDARLIDATLFLDGIGQRGDFYKADHGAVCYFAHDPINPDTLVLETKMFSVDRSSSKWKGLEGE